MRRQAHPAPNHPNIAKHADFSYEQAGEEEDLWVRHFSGHLGRNIMPGSRWPVFAAAVAALLSAAPELFGTAWHCL